MLLQPQMYLALSLLAVLLNSCAVHYYDRETQTEHVWGIGHMMMKAAQPNEGLEAIVHGTDVVGISIGKTSRQRYFTIGWQRLQYIDVLKESTAVRLEWPDGTFGNVRVGSKHPDDLMNHR